MGKGGRESIFLFYLQICEKLSKPQKIGRKELDEKNWSQMLIFDNIFQKFQWCVAFNDNFCDTQFEKYCSKQSFFEQKNEKNIML